MRVVSHIVAVEGVRSIDGKLEISEHKPQSADNNSSEPAKETEEQFVAGSDKKASREPVEKPDQQEPPSMKAAHASPVPTTAEFDQESPVPMCESNTPAGKIRLDFKQQVSQRIKEKGVQRVEGKTSVGQVQDLRRLAVTQASTRSRVTEGAGHSPKKTIPPKATLPLEGNAALYTPTQEASNQVALEESPVRFSQPITPLPHDSREGNCTCHVCMAAARHFEFDPMTRNVFPTPFGDSSNITGFVPRSRLSADPNVPAVAQGPIPSLNQTTRPRNQSGPLGSASTDNNGVAFSTSTGNYVHDAGFGDYRVQNDWLVPIVDAGSYAVGYDHMGVNFGSNRQGGHRGGGHRGRSYNSGHRSGNSRRGGGGAGIHHRGLARRRVARVGLREAEALSREEIAANAYLGGASYTPPKP